MTRTRAPLREVPVKRATTLMASALALAACKRNPPPAPSEAPGAVAVQGAPHNSDDPSAAYRVVEVRDGATLTGRVRWQGPRPATESVTVAPHGDPAHCGATQPLRPLVIADDGGVANAVVWLADARRGAAPSLAPVTIDQRGCRYEPHVATVSVGAELRFTSADEGVLHNVHAYYGLEGDDAWFNAASPAGVTVTRPVQRAGVVRLVCDAGHTWMLAYVHAFDHPYHAVTDASGRFTIRDVPAGVYRARMWHEGWTRRDEPGDPRPVFTGHVTMERPVTLTAGATSEVDFVMGR